MPGSDTVLSGAAAGQDELPSAETAQALIVALLDNASDLATDAALLLDRERYARAYALAVLAIEELGKTYLCLQVALGDPETTPRAFWRGWRHHGGKLDSAWAYHTAFVAPLDDADLDRLGETPERMGDAKMSALYVDLEPNGIRTPSSIDAVLAREAVHRATEAIGHATESLGLLTAEILPHLPQLKAVIDPALDRFIVEDDPVASLRALRTLLDAAKSDDVNVILAVLREGGADRAVGPEHTA